MALLIGAILVVSGPTVVLPLLSFVRPAARVRSLLTWEGVLVDPVGRAARRPRVPRGLRRGRAAWRPGEMLLSIAVGAAVAAVGAGVLWLLLARRSGRRRARRSR